MTLPRRWRHANRLVAALLCWIVVMLVPGMAMAGRIALVVGNARYEHIPPLATPAADTRAVAEALRRLGFEVTLLSDVSTTMFDVVLDAFGKDAKTADAVLFYYAGHAFQDAGVNRLVPVEARLDRADALVPETWSMDDIAARIGGSGTTLIFLDACRTSPVAAGLRGAGAPAQGLAEFDAAAGTFVSFSTRPGAVSFDQGTGPHSPFAQAFLDHLERPGQSVSDLMIKVRNAVEVATVGRQVPWDQSSLRAQFYFAGQDASPMAPPSGGDPGTPDPDAALLALMGDIVTDDTVVLGPAPAPPPPLAEVPVAVEPALPPAAPVVPLRVTAAHAVRPAIQAIAGGQAVQAGGATSVTRAAPQPRLTPVAAAAALRVPGTAVAGLDPSAAVAPAPEDLPRALQAELKRVGCYRQGVDGDWGQGSRNALRRYFDAKKTTATGLEPTEALWRGLKAETGQVCAPPPPEPVVAKKAPQKAKPAAKAPVKKQAAVKQPAPAKKPAAPAPAAKKQVKCTFLVVAIICK